MDAVFYISLIVFLVSLVGVFYFRNKRKKQDDLQAQFVVTGTLALIFTIVCFLSAICTILNFLWKWVI